MMTSRERLMRIFRNEEIDRPALKLWGQGIDNSGLLHPDYMPVSQLALELSDIFTGSGSEFDILYGKNCKEMVRTEDRDTDQETWKDRHTYYTTPKGELHAVYRYSTIGEPGYAMKYAVTTEEDIEKILSVDYAPFEFDSSAFFEMDRRTGDKGVCLFNLHHAAYAFYMLTGSENLAFLSVDSRELVDEAIRTFASRIKAHVKDALNAGIKAPFGWVGPELMIPPLMSYKDFDDFALKYDSEICDEIHNGGGYVWVHCHGKVATLLDRYIDMGVDVLNPLEPPKNGDVDMNEIVAKYGNKIGLEGNIEIQDIIESDEDTLKHLIKECIDAGKKSGRFILCPSAGYNEYINPSKRYIDNLITYLRYGYEQVNAIGG